MPSPAYNEAAYKPQAYVPHACVRDDLGGKAADFYDFSIHGGAVGTIELPLEVPANAVITKAYAFVDEAVTTGASGTLSIGLNTTTDLLGATAAGSLTANAVINLLPNFTEALDGNAAASGVEASTPLRLTAKRKLKVAIATGALTAGKVGVYLEWFGPLDNVESR